MKMSERRVRFTGRGRKWPRLLLLAAVLATVLWAIAQVLGWPVWARAVLAGLAAVAAVIVPELRARFEQDDTRTRLVEQRVAVSGGSRHLPLIWTVGLDQLRVHAARVQVPYIKRDQQDELEKSVGPEKAVLVVGHSMSGKTRLAAQVVKRKFPDAPLVAVESGKALQELFDGGLDPAGTVVWLDDLERFLGADGLTVNLLNRLTTGRAIVVATIRTEQRETYRPQDKLRPPEWEVLQRFNEISLQRRLTGPELSRVRTTVNDPGILDAVDHYGLAEYLGAGPEALDKFEKGEIGNPLGHALVRAAIDWRRTGLTRPVSQQVLATMLPTYLADRPDVPRTKQTIDEGLAWATMKINETVALLGQVFTGSNGPVFNAFDYLVDQLESTKKPIPNQVLSLALEQAESDELTVIGYTAYRAGNLAIAETAWRRASDSYNYPFASLNLGWLLEDQGDVEGAKAAYQKAIKSRDLGPMVALNLVRLLVEQGDLEGAKVAYQTGNLATAETAWGRTSDGVPLSSFNLGVLRDQQADLEGAKVAYQEAIDSGHADQAPMAALSLGWLQEEQGDLEGAKAAYQRAIDSGHADTVPLAALSLGKLQMDQGT
jgi:tetratricopeptide (TPR) repeat protein